MLIAILDGSPLMAQGHPALALSPQVGRGDPSLSHLGGRVGAGRPWAVKVGAMIYTRRSD